MGLYRRLFKGASGRDSVAPRSPEDARVAQELSEELRDLKDEIRKLREALLDSSPTARRSDGRRRGSGGRSSGGGRSQGGSFSERGRNGPAKVPPDDAPTGPLVDYLKKHKVTVFEGQDDLARNEAFEHLARHLGQHFSLLGAFYEKLKRAVATGRTTRVDIDNYSEGERSAAVQLGTLLYRHGMLKDFYYHRSPRKQLRVIPNKDGETQQFLTGGWLEIYVVWLLSKRLKDRLEASEFQVLFNVKGTLPAGNEFEADLMASIKGRLLWLECKTGQWQDYSARFRGLVQTFGTERTGAGLVLIKSPDTSTRARATDMLDMTLLSLDDVETYVDDFLEVPKEERQPKQHRPPVPDQASRRSSAGRGRPEGRGGGRDDRQPSTRPDGRSSSDSRNRPARGSAAAKPRVDSTKPEDATPLKDAAPARRLGKVQLDDDRGIPRRRRRRRSRARTDGGATPEVKTAESLREELPMDPIKGGEEPPNKESKTGKSPEIPAGMLAPKPSAPIASEDKKARKAAADADSQAKELVENSVDGEEKARRPRRRRRPTRSSAAGTEVSEDGSTSSGSKGEKSAAADSVPKEVKLDFGEREKPAKESIGAAPEAAEGEVAKPVRKKRAKRKARTSKKTSAKPADVSSESSPVESDAEVKTVGEEATEGPRKRAKRRTKRVSKRPMKSESSDDDSVSTKPSVEKDEQAVKPSSDSNAEAPDKKPAPRRKRASKAASSKAPKETPFEDLKSADVNPKRSHNAEPKAKKPAAEEKPAKAEASKRKLTTTGVTITPDLSAMIAGSSTAKKPKETDEPK